MLRRVPSGKWQDPVIQLLPLRNGDFRAARGALEYRGSGRPLAEWSAPHDFLAGRFDHLEVPLIRIECLTSFLVFSTSRPLERHWHSSAPSFPHTSGYARRS